MDFAKFPSITVDLERKIRSGFYRDRIPLIDELMQQYGVSRQTIVNALRPLTAKRLLISKGSFGLWVNRKYSYPRKKIGIICPGPYSEALKNPHINNLKSVIEADGNAHEMVCFPRKRFIPDVEKLLPKTCRGFIFFNSSLTFATTVYLQKKKIPFVSCTYSPLTPKINYVDFDTFAAIKSVAVQLVQAGYREIALFFPASQEGFNDYILKKWGEIKEELQLPIMSSDKFLFDWREPSCKKWLDFQIYLHEHKESPQAIIFWGEMKLPIPENCLVVGRENANYNFPANVVQSRRRQGVEIILKGYELLLELLSAPVQRKVQRLYKYEIESEKPIPKCREFFENNKKKIKFTFIDSC